MIVPFKSQQNVYIEDGDEIKSKIAFARHLTIINRLISFEEVLTFREW